LYYPLLAAWREVDVIASKNLRTRRRCGPRHPAWRPA
jgi:hypothetical protein